MLPLYIKNKDYKYGKSLFYPSTLTLTYNFRPITHEQRDIVTVMTFYGHQRVWQWRKMSPPNDVILTWNSFYSVHLHVVFNSPTLLHMSTCSDHLFCALHAPLANIDHVLIIYLRHLQSVSRFMYKSLMPILTRCESELQI